MQSYLMKRFPRYDLFCRNARTSRDMVTMVWNSLISCYGKELARKVLWLTLLLSLLNVLSPMVVSILVDSKTSHDVLTANHGLVLWLLSYIAPDRTIRDLIPHFIIIGLASFFLLNVVGKILLFFRGSSSELMVCDNARHVDKTVFEKFFEKAVIMHVTHERLLAEPVMKKGKDKTRNIQDVILWMGTSAILGVSLVYFTFVYNFPYDGVVITLGILLYCVHSVYINQEVLRVCNPLEHGWSDYNRYYVERQREFRKVVHNNKVEYERDEVMARFGAIIEPDSAFWAYWYPTQNTIRGIVIYMVLTGIVAHGAYNYYHDQISAGLFCSLVAWGKQIADSLWEIAQLEHQFNHVTPSILKLKAAFELPMGIKRPKDGEGIRLPPDSPFEVEFRNVSYRYGDANSDTFKLAGQLVLEDVSFKIPHGKNVALVGMSGRGKSTIDGLLMGDMDPTSGVILIDGHDLRDLDRGSVLDCIGYIPQEPDVLDGTVFYNICYGLKDPRSGSREKAEKVVKMCKLDFLRDGLDTLVGSRGVKLSGGQKQRLVIAMAIMKDPKLIVMDEGTSSLDPTSKKEVQENIDLLLEGNISALIITHDVNAVRRNCGLFLFLDKTEESRGSSIVAEAESLEELAVRAPAFRQIALDGGIVL
ncbi:MAG: ABC transporter ATP-binding protein/permease [Candidatus Vogelbacteria bacterium]|nr:ABC transporter ATP-binding protein/permease [Candidatus Vogelbacteria bacterium]